METERLWLRPIEKEDADKVEEYASDYELSKTTLNIPYPYPKGSALTFIESVLEAQKNGRIVIFSIVEKETGSLVGLINLNITPAFLRGELGYWIGKPYWGLGYGTEASKALLQYGFETLLLRKIYAQAFTTNPGSWRIMEKIGLKYEGTLKKHVMRDGNEYDLAIYGLLREEYVK